MKNSGKFIAKVTVNGRAMDSKGNIISRDTNGLPSVWLQVEAGSIPNRQTITGTVAQRMGIPLDSNGIIGANSNSGSTHGFVLIYGSWLHTGNHEDYGPQFSWTVLKDMTNASIKELEESIEYLGEPSVFTVEKANLPSDYVRKTTQHVSATKLDPKFHPANQVQSNVTEVAKRDVGPQRTDTGVNPEVEVKANAMSEEKPF